MKNKLKESFAEALDVSIEIINEELEYRGIVEWDSITHMFLISQIEDDFDVSISPDDVIDMSSFSKALELIKRLKNE
tara:strand:- start:741 stop:971 length:231 start_codon:yes stop_codon:yes gene_type:complete